MRSSSVSFLILYCAFKISNSFSEANLIANFSDPNQAEISNVLQDILDVYFFGKEKKIEILYFENELSGNLEDILINLMKSNAGCLKFYINGHSRFNSL